MSPLPTPALSVSGSKGIISALFGTPWMEIYYNNAQNANCLILIDLFIPNFILKIFFNLGLLQAIKALTCELYPNYYLILVKAQ
jgi:hypothetical protein